MRNNSNYAFVDTSFFKAVIDPRDDFYQDAKKIEAKINDEQIKLITSNYVLDEAFTLLRKRCGLKVVEEFRRYLTTISVILKIVRVTVADEGAAWEYFTKDWSGLSFTDSVSFAMMKRLNIKVTAAFDNHFKRAGFTIV